MTTLVAGVVAVNWNRTGRGGTAWDSKPSHTAIYAESLASKTTAHGSIPGASTV